MLALTVAGLLFDWFTPGSAGAVKVELVGFREETGKKMRAVLSISNHSPALVMVVINDIRSGPIARSHPGPARDELLFKGSDVGPGEEHALLSLAGSVTNTILLPNNGARFRLRVFYWVEAEPPPRIIRWLRSLLNVRTPRCCVLHSAECEQEIQCPRQLPDGTIEPPSVVTKEPR